MARKKSMPNRSSIIGLDLDSYMDKRRKIDEHGSFYKSFVTKFRKKQSKVKEKVSDYVVVEASEDVSEVYDEPKKGLLARIRGMFKFEIDRSDESNELDLSVDEEGNAVEKPEEPASEYKAIKERHSAIFDKIKKKHLQPEENQEKQPTHEPTHQEETEVDTHVGMDEYDEYEPIEEDYDEMADAYSGSKEVYSERRSSLLQSVKKWMSRGSSEKDEYSEMSEFVDEEVDFQEHHEVSEKSVDEEADELFGKAPQKRTIVKRRPLRLPKRSIPKQHTKPPKKKAPVKKKSAKPSQKKQVKKVKKKK